MIALVVLRRTVHLPATARKAKVDWAGALVTVAVSLLLLWVTFAGDKYDWVSWQTGAMLLGFLALTALYLFTESRAPDPVVPLSLFRSRTIVISVAASFFVGLAMTSRASTGRCAPPWRAPTGTPSPRCSSARRRSPWSHSPSAPSSRRRN